MQIRLRNPQTALLSTKRKMPRKTIFETITRKISCGWANEEYCRRRESVERFRSEGKDRNLVGEVEEAGRCCGEDLLSCMP